MVRHKSFLLSKHDDVNLTQDWLESEHEAGRYAVADGVSNSYHPEYVAKALCELFTALPGRPFDDWAETCRRDIFPRMEEQWCASVEEFVASLTPFNRRLEAARAERWRDGASTFCAIAVDEDSGNADFAVIGDSTLFVVGDDGFYASFCTSPSEEDENGRLYINYSTNTNAVVSDGTTVGEWRTGAFPLRAGFIVLLTDAMAKWFQQSHYAGLHPERMLWELETQDEFALFAKHWRERGEMDDDLAVIILQIEDGEPRQRMLPSLRMEQLLPAFLMPKSQPEKPQTRESRFWLLRKIADFFNR